MFVKDPPLCGMSKRLLNATNLLQNCSKKITFYLNKMQSGNETLAFS